MRRRRSPLKRLRFWFERWAAYPKGSAGAWWFLIKAQFEPRWLRDAIWWVRHRTTHRFDRIYIPTLKPAYHDHPEKLLHACMAELTEFIENEADILDWSGPESQPAWDEMAAVYLWWTKQRPLRCEPWADMPELVMDLDGPVLFPTRPSAEEAAWRRAADRAMKLEAEFEAEDTAMLVRLMRVRSFLSV